MTSKSLSPRRVVILAAFPDGLYRGTYAAGIVKATVEAVKAGGRIQKITIVCIDRKGKPAEVIVNEAVSKRSWT